MRAGGGEKEKAKPDASIFSRGMRGQYNPMTWISRKEGFFLFFIFYRKEDRNGLEVVMSKDDADPTFWPGV